MSANNQNLPLSKRESTLNDDDRSDSYSESDDQSYSVKHDSNMKDR
jgi:hypothetical protein